MKLSVVIPALNEANSVAICIRKAFAAIRRLGISGEVIVADNGSTDATVKIAEAEGARVVRIKDKGYGHACMGGLDAGAGEWLIMGDADDSYNFDALEPFVRELENGSELVIGNRFRGRIEPGAMPPLHRYLGTPVLAAIMNLFFRTGIGDPNCGLRAMTRSAFRRMQLRAAGMEFAIEMTVKAARVGLRISEVPCDLFRDKRGRRPHLNTWSDGWRALRFMLLFSTTWTFLIPGAMLALAGTLGMAVLTGRDLLRPELWLPTLSQKHMLSSMLVALLGTQVLGMGLAADAFTYSHTFDRSRASIRLLRAFRLERGLQCGLLLLLGGALTFAYLLVSYNHGLPSPGELLRFDIAVLAAFAVLVGAQLIFLSFLLSLFYIKVK